MDLSQITPSLFSTLGLADAQDLINCGPSPSNRELLFLIDGFGAEFVENYLSIIPNIAQLFDHGKVQTPFPSTTSTSLATLTTGVLPGAHGMLGYTVQVPRSGGRVLNSLKWDERVDPAIWQPVPTLFERAAAAGINVTHVAAKRYEDSGFTRAVFRGAKYRGANIHADLISETVSALKDVPAFVYLYVNDLDAAGHSDGVGSAKWLAALANIDQLVGELILKVPEGTRLWLTADHGMINVKEKIVINAQSGLLNEIAVIAGEPRARHLYLSPSHSSESGQLEVLARWQEILAEKIQIFTRKGAIDSGIFGAEVTPDASDRMGDLIVFAQGGAILIDPNREGQESLMVGHHGANSEAESTVPLLTMTK